MNNKLAATFAESSFMHEIQELASASQRIQWSSIIDAGRLMMDADHVITIGVGKSAFMAKRMSASLTSIGIKSVFLHPIDALHGDIGIIGKNDIIIIFSCPNYKFAHGNGNIQCFDCGDYESISSN